MSNPILVEPGKDTSPMEDEIEIIVSDNLSVPDSVSIQQSDDSSHERKNSLKGSTLRPDVRYGRAVSQPDEPDEVRHARFRIGGFYEDHHDHGSPIPSASARRSQRNSRRRSNHSLYGVSPNCKFGPKGFLVSSTVCTLQIMET